MNESEVYYSISKVAQILPVSRQMVYKMLKTGKFPNAVEHSGAVRIPASDVRQAAITRAHDLKREASKWEIVAA